MNINSGIIFGDRNQVVVFRNEALWLLNTDCAPYVMVEEVKGARFLTACPAGEYFAFWADERESFRLVDIAGEEIWSCWMNTDKATPHGIHFSTLGDAVACIYDFEGLPGLFLCDFKRPYATLLGCSNSTIGYDSDLKYFVIDGCDPYEDELLAFYERDNESGGIVKVPPQVVSEKLKKSPLIVDRNRCIYPCPELPIRDWDGLAIQGEMKGFVVLTECNLHWLTSDSDKPEVTFVDCIPQSDSREWFRCTLTVCNDNALIQSVSYGRSVVVNRRQGVIWRGNDLASTMLRGQRIVAQYAEGIVEVIGSDGSIEKTFMPRRGFRTLAADIIHNTLYIASAPETGPRIEIKTFTLSGRPYGLAN